jgi:speckle-type POZ protein
MELVIDIPYTSDLKIETQQLNSTLRFRISNFLNINETIISKEFSLGFDTEWLIQINPYYNKEGVDYVSVYLHSVSSNGSIVRAKYFLSIIDNKNDKKITRNTSEHDYLDGKGFGFSLYIKREELINRKLELLPNNKLSLFFDIDLVNNNDKNTIGYDFKNFFNNQKFSDFKFIIDEKEIFVHKMILSNVSSVFSAMFEMDMKEMSENQCLIDDIEFHVFEELVRFIYTGKTTKVKLLAPKLLPAAEKYNILQLKSICEDIIYFDLTNDNALKTLVFADKYNAIKLSERVISFIVNNLQAIRNNTDSGWKIFIKENPELVDKLFKKICDKTDLVPMDIL